MVFAPVDPAIKEKIISAYLAGHGRNAIFRQLNDQGIKISHGSVSNFINAYRKKHEQSLQQLQQQPQPSPPPNSRNNLFREDAVPKRFLDAGISTGFPIKKIGSPVLASGVGLAATKILTPRDGGPLSWLGEDVTEESNYLQSPTTGDLLIKNIETVNEENETAEEETEQYQSNSNSEIGIDWDSEELWERRFIRYVMDDKRWRQQQLQLIEQKEQELEQKRQELAQMSMTIAQMSTK